MKEINTYSYIMNEAIKSNTLTNDDLKNSSLYTDYWLACSEVATSIVRMNYQKTKLVRSSKDWDFEDLCVEFAIVLVRKFQAQINAMLNPKLNEYGVIQAHNHNAYTTTIFTNWIKDLLKPLEIKKKQCVIGTDNKEHYIYKNVTYKDLNGNEAKAYYNVMSLSAPIINDNSLTIEDTLEDDTYNPESSAVAKADEIAAKKESFEQLKKMCKMKTYLGCVYIYIEDMLVENCIKPRSLESILKIFNNIESKSPAFQLAAQKAFVRAYNNDLVKFVDSISERDIDDEGVAFILTHYSRTFEDFGRRFHIDENTIYHRRNEYKKTLAKINGIEISKKYVKNINK